MHVPGWHEATKKLQDEGKIQMVGIIQEQHPDRARLFMQWKQMGWPILIDSLDLLGVSVVPMTIAIDENGIIRKLQMPLRDAIRIEEEFVNVSFDSAGKPARAEKAAAADLNRLRAATNKGTAGAWRSYADALILWSDSRQLDAAIHSYRQALKLELEDPATHFRLGVAYRKRYDSPLRQPDDFRNASEQWSKALDLDPNNYIWRRRIQQYGPRLDKPYPFYDWVAQARKDVLARNETPAPLSIEPGGAEFAKPLRSFETDEPTKENPDPKGRIVRDPGKFIQVETAVVPPAISPGASARVYVVFSPNRSNKAYWNNEVDGLAFWIDPLEGWQADKRFLTVPNPRETVSQETREIQFEVRCPENAGAGAVQIPAYALYYVCEDVNGTCLYRRSDVAVRLEVKPREE